MRADCKCTLLQKTHDFSLDTVLDYLPVSNRTDALDHYKRKGIFVIRNPFSAIYSYRNFNFGGLKGTAADSAFKGPSKNSVINLKSSLDLSIANWEFNLKIGMVSCVALLSDGKLWPQFGSAGWKRAVSFTTNGCVTTSVPSWPGWSKWWVLLTMKTDWTASSNTHNTIHLKGNYATRRELINTQFTSFKTRNFIFF